MIRMDDYNNNLRLWNTDMKEEDHVDIKLLKEYLNETIKLTFSISDNQNMLLPMDALNNDVYESMRGYIYETYGTVEAFIALDSKEETLRTIKIAVQSTLLRAYN